MSLSGAVERPVVLGLDPGADVVNDVILGNMLVKNSSIQVHRRSKTYQSRSAAIVVKVVRVLGRCLVVVDDGQVDPEATGGTVLLLLDILGDVLGRETLVVPCANVLLIPLGSLGKLLQTQVVVLELLDTSGVLPLVLVEVVDIVSSDEDVTLAVNAGASLVQSLSQVTIASVVSVHRGLLGVNADDEDLLGVPAGSDDGGRKAFGELVVELGLVLHFGVVGEVAARENSRRGQILRLLSRLLGQDRVGGVVDCTPDTIADLAEGLRNLGGVLDLLLEPRERVC